MATDARGHTVPTGTDFAQRKSLTDLSLSIPSIKSVASEAAATLHLAELSDAGITPSVANPVWAWRSDTQALMRYDGAAWEWVTPRDTGWVDLASKAGSSTDLRARRIGDVLYLSGSLYGPGNATIANGAALSNVGVLPSAVRSTATRYLTVGSWVSGGNPAYGRTLTMLAYADGTLSLFNTSGNASSCAVVDIAFVM